MDAAVELALRELKLTIDEVDELIRTYYESKDDRAEHGSEEADKVSARIARLLSDHAFVFSPVQYISIHKELFRGIYSHAGKLRDYNITKKEWVLEGESVSYGSALNLRETLDYDFSQERAFRYNGLTMAETIRHLARFISRLWQIHIFGEGNTRTTAVFFIKYLRNLGFEVDNGPFAEHSWYFRNALVRANYNNIKKGIYETTEYLEKFLQNLLLGEQNALHNREMHVSGRFVTADEPIKERGNDPIKPNERESNIIDLIRSEPGITRAKMAEALGCSESTVSRSIQAMISKNKIRRIGSNKKGEWIIVE